MNPLLLTLLLLFLIVGCTSKISHAPLPKPQKSPSQPQINVPDKTQSTKQLACPSNSSSGETGLASYYHNNLHGNKTASGEPYNKNFLTAAHRTLAFGTKICVINLSNSQSVVVRINDRGPHIKGRIVDLSWAAAKQIGLIKAGITRIRIQLFE